MALVKCKNCGAEMTDNATKCYKCGSTNDFKVQLEKAEQEKEEKQNNTFAIIFTIVILICIFLIIRGIWKSFKGKELMNALGVEVENDGITFKGKDKDKLKNWTDDAMKGLGFSYEE